MIICLSLWSSSVSLPWIHCSIILSVKCVTLVVICCAVIVVLKPIILSVLTHPLRYMILLPLCYLFMWLFGFEFCLAFLMLSYLFFKSALHLGSGNAQPVVSKKIMRKFQANWQPVQGGQGVRAA